MTIDPDALNKRWAELQRRRAIEQAIGEDKLSASQIARQFGIDPHTVANRRKRMGIEVSRIPKQRPLPEQTISPAMKARIIAAAEAGATLGEIVAATGLHSRRVSPILRGAGINLMERPRSTKPRPEPRGRGGPYKRKQETP